jgi:hypothetical protein
MAEERNASGESKETGVSSSFPDTGHGLESAGIGGFSDLDPMGVEASSASIHPSPVRIS